MTYIVTAPLVLVADLAGSIHHVYEGSQLPTFASEEFVLRMLDTNLIYDVDGGHAIES